MRLLTGWFEGFHFDGVFGIIWREALFDEWPASIGVASLRMQGIGGRSYR
jgi:hypothetical protein